MKELIAINNELYNKYKQPPQIYSWGSFLNSSYEWAIQMRNYTRAAAINELIRIDIEEPGPNSSETIKKLYRH